MTQTSTTKVKVKKKTALETFKDINPLTFGEEIGNSVSHGVAALLMLIALPYAAVHSYLESGALMSVSVSVFVISLFLMFLSSTVYHTMQQASPHKYVMRIIDHSMIYVAITGTYTPVALVLVGGWLGWSIMIILWGTTIWGILYKAIATKVNSKLSLMIYLLMGWVGVIFLPIIMSKGLWLFLIFILLGGISYTIGAWFYAQKDRPYFHMIWHIFILIASLFHFVGILYFM